VRLHVRCAVAALRREPASGEIPSAGGGKKLDAGGEMRARPLAACPQAPMDTEVHETPQRARGSEGLRPEGCKLLQPGRWTAATASP